jgi:tight adherence protein C
VPALSYEHLVPFLTFASVIAIGGGIIAARVARRDPIKARLQKDDLLAPQGTKPKSMDVVERLGSTLSGTKGASSQLKQQLIQAGYHEPSAPSIYIGSKLLLLLAGFGASASALLPLPIAIHYKVLGIAMIPALLSFLPNFWVSVRRSKRRLDVQIHLADAVDLLEICVSSGMGLDMAWNSVSDEMRRVSTTLADEMALTNLEIHLGAPRAQAMRNMAGRTGAEEISSMVATIVQSDRFGTSIADALRVFATSMREQRSQKAEEAAEKMAVMLLFPMVLCIFPAMLIVVAAPSVITFFKTVGG